MSLHTIIAKSEKFLGDNSPLILTGIGAAGVITTAYLSGKASIRAYQILDEAETDLNSERYKQVNPGAREHLTKQQKFLLIWKLYLPATGVASLTIAAIIMANRIDSRRMAALAAGIAVSDRALGEYKEKVIEKLGDKKAKEVTDDIAQDKLKGLQTAHVPVAAGDVLMLDTYTMKPFSSTMERVRKVENDLRELLNNGEKTVTCSDWLSGIGLRKTPYSDDFGWNAESGFKLDYTAGLTDDNLPCLVWHFVIDPTYRPTATERVTYLGAPPFRDRA